MKTQISQGDFTELAKHYSNRPGYSAEVLALLGKHVGACSSDSFRIADVGAGTGKLTEQLHAYGWNVVAVEPNDSMRAEGMKSVPIEWRKGSGEETGLPSEFANWLLMASSFHWVDPKRGLPEFARVLKPGGHFTALWNPRDIERSEFHKAVERKVSEIVPELKRVSSGSADYTVKMFDTITSTGHFAEPLFVESRHEVCMARERYLNAWRSVNDIQAQAGAQRFEQIMTMLEKETLNMKEVIVPYRTRSWTAAVIK